MKTQSVNYKFFAFVLVIILIVFGVEGISYGQNLNVGEPRTVRMIYFLPNDLPYRADVVQKMKDDIRTVQTFYAEQMQAHGYGDKTFRYETDNRGEPLVQRVDGQHPFSHYDKTLGNAVLDELSQTYDLYANIYFIVFGTDFLNQGNGRPAIGVGRRLTKNGGYALVANEFSWKWIAHELGHAFGLLHDFRDDSYVLSYGRQDQLSACTANFLSVHPYFNSAIPLEESSLPSIRPISPSAYPIGLKSVPIRLKVFDVEGLHQVFLYVYRELKACKALAGEKDTVVEFEYDGLIPSEGSTDLYDPNVHEFQAMVVDVEGNIKSWNFGLAALSPQHRNTFEHESPFTSATFSPVDMTIASSSWGVVELWDVVEGVSIATLPHTRWVSTVAFSHDGEILATGSEDKTVKLWDVATETNIATFKEHTARITSLSFSPDGGTLAVGQADGKVKLWDIATETSIKTLEEHTRTVTVLFSPDERILATGSLDNTIMLWDVATWRVISPLEGPRDSLGTQAMSFSFDGTILATGSFYRGTIELWDMTTREHIATLPGHIGSVDAVSFSPDGRSLASGAADFTVKLWDVETGVNLTTFNGHWHWVESVSFSDDGRLLASASHDKSIKLWDLSEVMDLRRNALVSVDIPDPILRAAITTAFGKPSDATLYRGDLTELRRLKKENADIKDLNGIETAHNLKRLDLSENKISDISHVAGLTKLTWLFLRDNLISDISPIAGLTKLTSLNLGENQVSDISHVAGLTKLDLLALHQNNISDISHVAGLTNLEYLGVMGNLVSDISHVAKLTKLTNLDIGGNSVSDISPIANLANLQFLTIGNNLISDISHVAKLKYLDFLHCPNNLISDISPVAKLKYLTRLSASFNRISDLSPVAELTNLKLLQFRGNTISDLSPLVENTGLGEGDEVDVQDNPLSYASIHTHIPTLQKRGVKVIFDDQSPTTFLKISEVMFASNDGNLPQWIELYNRSTTHPVNLKGWTLEIQNYRSKNFNGYQNLTITFKEKSIKPNKTLLIVSKQGRASKQFRDEQIFDLNMLRSNLQDVVLSEEGFYMKLTNAAGEIIDEVGNLDGKKNTNDKPTWRLPKSITKDGARASMIRRQVNGTSLLGTEAFGWISAKNTKLVNKTTNYYGHLHDIGSPGIESGGALPVQLSRFRADHTDAGVVIKWTTESELENAGFNILRSETKNGKFKVINSKLIQGAGTTGERNIYTWTDTSAKPNTVYYYRIEDVSHAGEREQLATVRLRGFVSAKGKLTTKWGDLKRQD